jgi:hypothetical protein
MQLSKKFEFFVVFFADKIRNSEQKSPWIELLAWKSLEQGILTSISNKLYSSDLTNDGNHFQNNVLNHIDINRNNLTQNNKDSFAHIDYMTQPAKDIMNEYLEIVLNDNYILRSIDDPIKMKLYFQKLLIPVFVKWRKSDFSKVYQTVTEFNKLTEKHNVTYNPVIYYDEFLWKIWKEIIEKKDVVIFELINFLDKLSKDYAQEEKFTKKFEELTLKDESKEVKKEDTKKTAVDHKNKSNNVKISEIVDSEDDNDEDNKFDLDNLKVQGLKDLCKKLKLNTNRCNYRQDYVNLLQAYIKRNK